MTSAWWHQFYLLSRESTDQISAD